MTPKSVIPIEMQSLWWSPLRWESKNQISLQVQQLQQKHRAFRKCNQEVSQKRFHAHYCLDGHSGIDDWNFVIF